MKKLFLPIILVGILLGCSEDISDKISTDLTKEAEQFYLLTEALGENSYLGNLTFSDYFRMDSTTLPSCPQIDLDSNMRTITLDYDIDSLCTQTNQKTRRGKIILDFSLANTSEQSWTMTYVNYLYENTSLEGTRTYKRISNSQNSEAFENLRVSTSSNLNFTVNGSFTYFISLFTFRPYALSYVGKMTGTNPVGREFTLTITEPKELYITCYAEGYILPLTGKDNWKVSRGNSDIGYLVTYEETEECQTVVKATLPDGRTYILHQ